VHRRLDDAAKHSLQVEPSTDREYGVEEALRAVVDRGLRHPDSDRDQEK
jgi:hypothetical protein